MSDKRLFLLDGMALIYRSYFAFINNPRINSSGLNTSAMFGFTLTLLDLLQKEKPSHIAVVFDTAAPTERHEMFDQYKAHREEMPEDLAKSIPYIFEIIRAFRIPVITLDGFEADDIIGTLALKAEKEGYVTYMMTPDKDYAQLVSPNIFMYKPSRMGNGIEILGVEEIKQKWEVSDPLQVIDILGLWGDSSDNIPGIPGVGEKTAKQLIGQYGSIEGIYEHIHELKGKMKERFEQHKEQAFLSKKLATIILDVPVDFDEEDFNLDPPDKDKITAIFNQLEFKTLLRRVLGDPAPQPVQGDLFAPPEPVQSMASTGLAAEPVPERVLKTIADTPHEYVAVTDAAGRKDMIHELLKAKAFCFDTETTSLNPREARILGCALSHASGKAWYVVFPEDFEAAGEILQELKVLLEHPSILKIAQNLKYDLLILRKYGVHVKGPCFDTMLAHYLIEPDMRHNMDALAEHYLHYRPVSIEELIGKKGKNQLSFDTVPLDKAVEYAGEDADITLQLYHILEPEITRQELGHVLYDIEMPLVEVLGDMESVGVKVDDGFLRDYSAELEKESLNIEQQIYKTAGLRFNIASPKQLGEVLFEHLKLDSKAKKTKTGQYQTGEEILLKLSHKHALPELVLSYRELQKLKSTYVDALPALIDPHTGRVHTSFNQAVAGTGRLSSNNPNLQNIPIRTEKGREIRKAFVPADANHLLLSADYSQIELRIIASISEDEGMMEAFQQGMDIHRATAAKVFGVSLDEVDSDMRRKAKTVNFGIIYGISAFGLSERVNISRSEAKDIIDAYFEKFPGIRKYMDDTIAFCRMHGYVQTLSGRRRVIRDIHSSNQTVRGFAERNAINAPIQGTAADMIKLAMINIHRKMKEEGLQSRMILQVHDELLFDVPVAEKQRMELLVLSEMQKALPLKVPVEVEAGWGSNWLEAH